jgi:hypothetical protein
MQRISTAVVRPLILCIGRKFGPYYRLRPVSVSFLASCVFCGKSVDVVPQIFTSQKTQATNIIIVICSTVRVYESYTHNFSLMFRGSKSHDCPTRRRKREKLMHFERGSVVTPMHLDCVTENCFID